MIVIEGIIGAGKTTLSEKLANKISRSIVCKEPVDENPYLESFYKEPERWALEMQYYLMAMRYRMHAYAIQKEWSSGCTTIHDRSIYGDGAFARILFDSGLISNLGYSSYLQHRECMEKQLLVPQLVIYLNVKTETALSRIKSRGRECESGIPDSYLKQLDNAYKEYVLPDLEKKTIVEMIDWEDCFRLDEILNLAKKTKCEFNLCEHC